MLRPIRFAAYTVAGTLGLAVVCAAPAGRDGRALAEDVIATVCALTDDGPHSVPEALGIGAEVERVPIKRGDFVMGVRDTIKLEDGGELMLQRVGPREALRRLSVEYRAPRAGGVRPQLLIIADGRCRVQNARRIEYDRQGRASTIVEFGPSLDKIVAEEPLDAPVPSAPNFEGVRVALVDSGVNYDLAAIAERLARDSEGTALGYDYWDLDARPFDANPVRSPFFVQRHGTQTASLLLEEAPVAALVPLRYPRPDMSRMRDLVSDASARGIVVVNISLGGNRETEWQSFAAAARDHPHMLFIVSAGNNGRDLDTQPVYPAALELDNMLTVTSADVRGLPAPGSNWGANTVDLLVPAEELVTTDFYGDPKIVSGSSYAAVRVSALAACLAAAHPDWRAREIKAAILALAVTSPPEIMSQVKHGLLPDPTASQRGACEPVPPQPVVVAKHEWNEQVLGSVAAIDATHEMRPTLVVVRGSGWSLDEVRAAAIRAAEINRQCGVDTPTVRVLEVDVPARQRHFRQDWSGDLASRLTLSRPAVFFVKDTLQEIAFDAEAIGRSNAKGRPRLVDTVWITSRIEHPGVALAHELYHVTANSGTHVRDSRNLMHERTSLTGTSLRDYQCDEMKRVGEAFGNVVPIE